MPLRLSFVLCFLCAALSLSTSIAAAQSPNYKIFTTRDGLAGNFITSILLDAHSGNHWIGTTEGATLIASDRWTSYTRAHGLGDSWITALGATSDGHIWFGTQSGGVSVFNPTTKIFTTYNLDNSDIPSNFITALVVDTENRVWIGTLNNGVAQFDPRTQQWSQHALPNTSVTFLFLAFDEIRTPWTIADGRVYALQNEQWELRALPNDERAVRLGDDHRQMLAFTSERAYIWDGQMWQRYVPMAQLPPLAGILQEPQITAAGEGMGEDVWYGTPRGLYVIDPPLFFKPPQPLPVILVHGWTVTGDDTLESSEFRFLKSYADRDGIPMYYARGVSPKNTLYQNAAVIRDEIARVKKETGAPQVNVIAFSMGGMNTRAYLESSLYANDVHRAMILGTPQAGVEIWKPILFQQILQKPDEPSAIELSPEYAQRIVNNTRSPNPNVTYDVLIGDARQQSGLDFLGDMPASDALISVHSALALDIPSERKHINSDLHDWAPEPVPLDLTGYLYPRETWERYLRNALRNNDNSPLGSEISQSSSQAVGQGEVMQGNHTPVMTKKIRAGETITNSILIDENKSARFIAYFPGGHVDVSLRAPDGKLYEPSDLPRDDDGVLTLSTDIASFSGYVVKNARVGEWQMILKRTDAGRNTIDVSTYAELDSPRRLELSLQFGTVAPGKPNLVSAFVMDRSPDEPSLPTRLYAFVAQPSESPGKPFTLTELELFDDGQHQDGAANDGYFANQYEPARGGWHLLFVQARGANYARERETLFVVDPNDARIQDVTVQQRRENLTVHANVTVKRAGDYEVSASLRRADTNEIVARQLSVFNLPSGTSPTVLDLDGRQLARGKYFIDLSLLDSSAAAFELDRTTALYVLDAQ